MAAFDPATIALQMQSARWSALARTQLSLDAIGRFDAALVRDTRVLVPIDVQALVVPANSAEPMVRLPLSIAAPDDAPPAPATDILADGPPRPAGVHLHWAMPDALLRGKLADNGPTNRLSLPPLPDRWIVLRVVAPKGASAPIVRGWVIEADTTRVVDLAQWPDDAAAVAATGRTVAPADLTGACGGSLNWTGTYDATLNRFALHDPLDDLAQVAPNGTEGDQLAYLVAGWWSAPANDPLDGAQTTTSLHERMRQLGWALVEDREDDEKQQRERRVVQDKQASIGLAAATRYAPNATLAARAPLATSTASAIPKPGLQFATASFVDQASKIIQTEPQWPRSSLLHGSVYGVSVNAIAGVDQRPGTNDVQLVWGEHGEDVSAVLASIALAPDDASARRAYERLVAAFTGNLVDRIDSADGVVDVEEWEHAAGYASRPGGDAGTDRLLEGADAGPLSVGRQARGAVARAAAAALKTKAGASTQLSFAKQRKDVHVGSKDEQRAQMIQWGKTENEREQERVAPETAGRKQPQAREVRQAAPRFYTPLEPLVAVRGAKRSLRHGGDGRASGDGKLHCRYPAQIIRAIDQVIDGADVLPTIGSAAVPDEVLLLARELVLHNPYWAAWLAAVATAKHSLDGKATKSRMVAEAALRFGSTQAVYDGTSGAFSRKVKMAGGATRQLTDERIADQLRRFSLVQGVDPDPVGVTAWSQPWIPLWLEWELDLALSDRLDGWALGSVDVETVAPFGGEGAPATPIARTLTGRSMLTTGTATALAGAVRTWLVAEDQRDADNAGEASEATEAALARIAAAVDQLDVVSANLDGVREQLLGLAYHGGLVRERQADDTLSDPNVSGETPLWLRGGVARLARARLVDAFGRTLALPVERLRAPERLVVASANAQPPGNIDAPPPAVGDALRLSPRLTLPARLMFRLVDPAARGDDAAEANVDQVEPAKMTNPVCGFVLPDHIDEALEFFDVAGTPLGQLTHEPIGGGVVWEVAPGRNAPADAGPLFDLSGAATHLGMLAAGTVAADAKFRQGAAANVDNEGAESALSAMLRAIDTTMWSVDALSGLGTEHIAGLVGRPIALVRVRLRLDLASELGRDAAAAASALADRAFTVRIGEITRADDAVLGYFVDDDYEHVHVVDKVVAQLALDSGRLRGQLAGIDHADDVPGTRPINHPYIVAEDELQLRFGQTVMLTLLMHPAGKANATCGVLPRKAIQLARDWVAPGLAVIAPSARVGPVLLDPAQVRLPKISSFPKDQLFTRRDTPATWKDDPILAATQEALLPDLPHEVQEGYIRIAPTAAAKDEG